MFCNTKCLFCDHDQIAKVNCPFYHGVCETHKHSAKGTIKCTYCNSTVSVFKIIDVIECNFCGELTSKSPSSCGHVLCNTCSISCKLCQNSSLNLSSKINLSIKNLESPEISQKSPKDAIFKNLSSTNKVEPLENSRKYRKCEYCGEKNALDLKICEHNLCKDCLKDGCSLCNLLSVTKGKNQNYKIEKTEKMKFTEKDIGNPMGKNKVWGKRYRKPYWQE
ncbi:hypothetical protein SteCoe_17407 [Stentor coeruleus]|uniref:RING-type domain-containing protein n=1 Tax=Stentor coeruleus TaxID=5963 RepID=A0A1R2BZ76_9CILI|nr:hypothetical protein SteCoe_17407 [Stentor coeruleus]